MKLRVVALGHRMPVWVAAGWDDYARRMPREFPVELIELKPEPRAGSRTVGQVLAAEGRRILAASKTAVTIVLDERGHPWTTRELANHLDRWRNEALDVTFVIGSADGLAEPVKRSAAAVVSLSALTLPHGLARVILVEQLYRAASLLAGHPYHRE